MNKTDKKDAKRLVKMLQQKERDFWLSWHRVLKKIKKNGFDSVFGG